MWKRELLKNKLYALLLVGLSLPIMFLDGGRDCDSFDAVLRRPHVLC